ncbi:arylesterase [Vibrio navarrensis]|uniref:multifunctional acyl-CoA thioesterase I/protease I/lysophospholipase L1 n=1 Tax=Vibrio navarrensis TaxID=29495 RepID=UPI00051D54A1|nr:multifunctional acyl-CoA thioesterase I/protease I/lysophospholipase L1 [Vibrio navarrensis]EGR2795870.1 multifunctional acyl-CoA thioesterase I/protease I/lysophospholipase L1 [Vibrio navarrensis]EJK2115094.1 multifunctional acyl-CoA thioesterase I/protease I/lysophospholipase L1 [Vibrio navarrensis]EJL6399530.1 multifunctional acyl-CoA thioesterase I/protease I/lysophospholipase L1 [Vibrio navarrensis]EJL6565497.1 multifunctional acyl-CoA thioesterase I/protease I/lysophospholipase L1 [Vib
MVRLFSLMLMLILSWTATAAEKILILGDSLSAGYNMPAEQAWPSLLPDVLKTYGKDVQVINASISGDTTGNGLARLPDLLTTHSPDWVLIELGANDGLRGFPPKTIAANLSRMIQITKAAGAKPALMQIRVPPNYGKRYSQAFFDLYPTLAEHQQVPLLPFFLEQVITKPEWMMQDGLHPTADAQPWIAEFVAEMFSQHL